MNVVLVGVFVMLGFSLLGVGFAVNSISNRQQQSDSDVDHLRQELGVVQNVQRSYIDKVDKIDGKVKDMFDITVNNNKTIRGEFDTHADDIDQIIARMEAVERAIARIDRDEKDLRTYYLNYVSREGYEESVDA